jgi:CDP-6-deoxy-D-xylo-4-hexulose-3-dehydrase
MIPLAVSSWDGKEEAAMIRVIASGRYTMGTEVAKFERQFAKYVGADFAIMVNSGSTANLLMIAALLYTGRLKRDATVIVPAVSWSTTYAPLMQFGLKMRVVDVDDSFNLDPAQVKDGDLLFAVNVLGNPCDFDRFPDIPMIVDNCESLGCRYKGKEGGTLGVMGSYSFFFSHHISTMEGGMIVTDDVELRDCLLMLRAHGWERDLPHFKPGFEASFRFQVPGYSVRPTELQGAIGQEQLEKFPDMRQARRQNGEAYKALFGHQREVGQSSWFGFALLVPNRAELVRLIDAETRPVIAGNILRQPMMRFAKVEHGPTPMADRIHNEGLFIGNHHYDIRAELTAIKERFEYLIPTAFDEYVL